MIGRKVICIDAGDKKWCIDHGMWPLKEGSVYTIRGEEAYGKGVGYLLEEIHNICNIVGHPGKEPGYAKHRFIPLSEIDESERTVLKIHLVGNA